MIFYKSTRGNKKLYKFSEVILKGMADDGGLFVPEKFPKLKPDQLKRLLNTSYREKALFVFNLFETDFEKKDLKKIIGNSYSANFDDPRITPLKQLKKNQYILELWHGPTLAFKDLALQLTANLFTEALRINQEDCHDRLSRDRNDKTTYLIIVATSGDTGKAALEGYKDKKRISIIVFYPDSGVSTLQELSMITQKGKNVGVFAVAGNFDDVQGSVKEIFADKKFNQKILKEKNVALSSANSINWGRLFPQIVYHVKSYVDLVERKQIKFGDQIDIAVPTGNFGNILSAFYAKKMGIPIRKLICASNENNVFTQFLTEGKYDIRTRKMARTPSPSMNILIGSNLERLLYELTGDSKRVSDWLKKLKENKYFRVDSDICAMLKKIFHADWVSNDNCLSTIRTTLKDTGYLLDPHTAVAKTVVEKYCRENPSGIPVVICSTAHWSKFAKDIYKALKGISYDDNLKTNEFDLLEEIKKWTNQEIPKNIAELRKKKIRFEEKCGPRKENMEKVILQFLESKKAS